MVCLKAGEEVTDSYGSTFSEEDWDDRRAKLKKDFWFSCLCLACRKKWPCRDDLPCNMFEARFCSTDLGSSILSPLPLLWNLITYNFTLQIPRINRKTIIQFENPIHGLIR